MNDEVMREALREKLAGLREELRLGLNRLDSRLLLGDWTGAEKYRVRQVAQELVRVVSESMTVEDTPILGLAEPEDCAIVVVHGHTWPVLATYAGDGWWLVAEGADAGGAARVHALDLDSASLVSVEDESTDENDVRPRYLDECERIAIHANGKWKCEDSFFDSLAEVMQVYGGSPVALEYLGREWPLTEAPSSASV